MYSEEVFEEALQEVDKRVNINGRTITKIRYADDTLIVPNNSEDLQELMNRITKAYEKYGLKLNVNKTKYIVISKKSNVIDNNIYVNGISLVRADKTVYLECHIDKKWDPSAEIKIRIEKSRAVLLRMRKLFCSHNLGLNLQVRMVKWLNGYVFSTFLYGVEFWTLIEAILKRIKSFEM